MPTRLTVRVDNLLPEIQVGQLLATAYTPVFAVIGHMPSVEAPTIQYPLPDAHWGFSEAAQS
jgi:hypothetical protein